MQHLKYHDRVAIEYEISENPDSTLRSVADKLGVSRSTVMREIIRNSTVTKSYSPVSLPGTPKQAPECPKLRKWPYCCNRCAKTRCHLTKLHYRAGEAERTSKATNAKAARKPSKETLRRAAEVEEKVAPMIKSGVSIEAAVKAAECDVHPTTIRRWIDRDIVSPSRVDLPRAAKFRPKALYDYSKAKRSDAPARITYGRTIDDYRKALLSGGRVAVQCDTVIGTVHDSHCILTVMIVRPKVRLQFGFRVRKTKEAVAAKVLWLWERMDAFGCAFGLLLTDNGPEFYGMPEIENDEAGVHRFKSYFCDPYNSSQKAECESNHRICRYGQGKGESVDQVSDQEILDLFSKVNSYPRESLGWLSPFQAFRKAFPDAAGLIKALGYEEIPVAQLNFKKK